MRGWTPLAIVPVLAFGLALSGCENERSAEAETSVSEAEVSTELPPAAISDPALDATAEAAAAVAATPAPTVVVTTPPVQGQAGATAGAVAQDQANPAADASP